MSKIESYASTGGEARSIARDMRAWVARCQPDSEPVAGPLVIAQDTSALYFVVADQVTWQTELCAQGHWKPMWNMDLTSQPAGGSNQ